VALSSMNSERAANSIVFGACTPLATVPTAIVYDHRSQRSEGAFHTDRCGIELKWSAGGRRRGCRKKVCSKRGPQQPFGPDRWSANARIERIEIGAQPQSGIDDLPDRPPRMVSPDACPEDRPMKSANPTLIRSPRRLRGAATPF
jgi:hypothetical protein